ncbi:hypothetical protein FRC09_017670 [Ceratobasidium sp. 395]|nr:hypothetical protein FRC09_017670 [Ceratobasidium sp. 395]
MSAPSYIIQSSEVLLIPDNQLIQITIDWQQRFQSKRANYHTGFVPVKGKSGEENQVLFFIQSEWYQDSAHMASLATKAGDYYELKVDGKSRYGQKNDKGEARFIVYHDTSRNPYQHRFVDQALRQDAFGIGQKVAQIFKVTGVASLIQIFSGDELQGF